MFQEKRVGHAATVISFVADAAGCTVDLTKSDADFLRLSCSPINLFGVVMASPKRKCTLGTFTSNHLGFKNNRQCLDAYLSPIFPLRKLRQVFARVLRTSHSKDSMVPLENPVLLPLMPKIWLVGTP